MQLNPLCNKDLRAKGVIKERTVRLSKLRNRFAWDSQQSDHWLRDLSSVAPNITAPGFANSRQVPLLLKDYDGAAPSLMTWLPFAAWSMQCDHTEEIHQKKKLVDWIQCSWRVQMYFPLWRPVIWNLMLVHWRNKSFPYSFSFSYFDHIRPDMQEKRCSSNPNNPGFVRQTGLPLEGCIGFFYDRDKTQIERVARESSQKKNLCNLVSPFSGNQHFILFDLIKFDW